MSYVVATEDIGVITAQQLDSYLGKSIGAICPNGYTTGADHHSAHFVSHVFGYNFGITCQMMGNGGAPGATIRLQDLFPHCKTAGVWSLRPASLSPCLVLITRASNVSLAAKSIANAPRKHVGIYTNGFIWHYSTSRRQVIRETPSQFKLHYPSPDNAMFYGSLP
jgi:hypothetical protein